MSKDKNDKKEPKSEKDEFQITLDFLGTQDPEIHINYKKIVEDKVQILEAEIEALKTQLTMQKQEAEEENLKNIAKIQTMARRHHEEISSMRKYGGTKLAEDILRPIDLFKKVLNSPVSSDEIKNYFIGFEMVIKQMEHALEENGIQQIQVNIGDQFDPLIHNGNETVESEEFKTGQIVAVISNGYKLYERVIMHALVKVAK
ncbi:nucleotide exchange factor GrpE [Williamsoniiplasma luminosum]|uniref:Protein GrpE n=1 Tax=Williamsoniiplasma luminosum TaxID=214888 RepID=A0A2S0NJM6_9MOLU|nr:nucleotide exchange factor GrpE [Williamsoniiplasma luminosum]AVP49211.1 MAG: nucleotide exchange factor GrpE [Williamsoniiplasma luminosum]